MMQTDQTVIAKGREGYRSDGDLKITSGMRLEKAGYLRLANDTGEVLIDESPRPGASRGTGLRMERR